MKKYTLISMLLAMSIVVSIIESFIPSIVVGSKLGLSNVITIIVLYKFGIKETLGLVLLRIFLVSLILGTFLSYVFFMSLIGGLLALLMMYLFKSMKIFNLVSVSIMGALGHSVGQIIVAIMMISFASIYYLPIMGLVSVITGIIVGCIARYGLLVLASKETNF